MEREYKEDLKEDLEGKTEEIRDGDHWEGSEGRKEREYEEELKLER